MKSRAIQTRFWDDESVSEYKPFTKYLYIYLLTCQYINVSGVFQLSTKKIIFETGLTDKQFEDAKNELTDKVLFHQGWVYVINAEKNNNYRKIPSNEVTYQQEWERVPKSVALFFKSLGVTDGSATDPLLTINNKSQIINNKPETKDQNLEEIKNHYNITFLKSIKITKAWSDNALEWLNTYSLKEIKTAITKATATGYWAKDNFIKKNGLEFLFRVRNKNGPCDYIGELINFRVKSELDDVINTEDLNDMIQRSKQEDARKHPKKSS